MDVWRRFAVNGNLHALDLQRCWSCIVRSATAVVQTARAYECARWDAGLYATDANSTDATGGGYTPYPRSSLPHLPPRMFDSHPPMTFYQGGGCLQDVVPASFIGATPPADNARTTHDNTVHRQSTDHPAPAEIAYFGCASTGPPLLHNQTPFEYNRAAPHAQLPHASEGVQSCSSAAHDLGPFPFPRPTAPVLTSDPAALFAGDGLYHAHEAPATGAHPQALDWVLRHSSHMVAQVNSATTLTMCPPAGTQGANYPAHPLEYGQSDATPSASGTLPGGVTIVHHGSSPIPHEGGGEATARLPSNELQVSPVSLGDELSGSAKRYSSEAQNTAPLLTIDPTWLL
ncbi:hypothetical protein C8Q77DRAFT_220639 [Trametes polyzona]|nr:hypothetical protein C8Q77DRAFT_220639 [Trametes polyzona]